MRVKIAVLGRAPTYSSIAAMRLFRDGVEIDDRYKSIAEVIAAVSEQTNPWGVVPLRNSSIARNVISDTEEALAAHPNVKVYSRRSFPIHLALSARRGVTLDEVDEVVSKAQALEQCSSWLDANLPSATRIPVGSTSQGVRNLHGETTCAVVGPAELAERYGLELLAEQIEDASDNETEFGVIVHVDLHDDLVREYLRAES